MSTYHKDLFAMEAILTQSENQSTITNIDISIFNNPVLLHEVNDWAYRYNIM